VLALASSQARASFSTFVSNLEDCTKQQISRGVNWKYLAEKLAGVVHEEPMADYVGITYQVVNVSKYRLLIRIGMQWKWLESWTLEMAS
jgi:hypothetical protein